MLKMRFVAICVRIVMISCLYVAIIAFAFLFCLFHSRVKLKNAWQEDEQGEYYGKADHSLVAIEEVDEIAVGALWHEVDNDIRNGVVDPMKHYAWYDGLGAIIHPSQQQADEESVNALGQVEMHDAEEQC